jgi:hypothetical protein
MRTKRVARVIACLYVPLFPRRAAAQRAGAEGRARRRVQGNGSAARIVAATRKARRAGVEAG